MKSTIFGNVLLFVFMQSIVPAYNTICYSCLGPNSETCKHVEVKCPNGTRCMTTSEEYVAYGKVYRSINKRCAMNLPCDELMYGFSDNNLYIIISPKCCIGDRCNSGFYDIPKNQTKEKGILCPSCHAYGTLDGCNATRSTVCWGENDQCLKYRATILRPDGVEYNISAQGCCSENACKYDYSQAASTKVVYTVENVCYLPTLSPPPQDKKP